MANRRTVIAMSNESRGVESGQRVTPLELFFDLVFVFAITQVTGFLAENPTWLGLLRGLMLLASAVVGLGGVRLADEHARPRRGSGPAGRVRLDRRHADRGAGRAERVRRRAAWSSASRTSWCGPFTWSCMRSPAREIRSCSRGAAGSSPRPPSGRHCWLWRASSMVRPRWRCGPPRWRSTTWGSYSATSADGASRPSTSSSATGWW